MAKNFGVSEKFFFSIFKINDFGRKFEASDFFVCVCSYVIGRKVTGVARMV